MESCHPAGPWLNNAPMKTLIIVRHGAFSHDSPTVPDIGHPLNRRGRREAAEAAERFAELNIMPDLILTSPACRAEQTTKIYEKRLKLPPKNLRVERQIFEAEKAEILRIVHRLNDARDVVMLVGHNPGMTDLLHHLVDSDIEKMPSSSFAVVELAVDSWLQVSFKHSKLIHYYAPEVKEVRLGWWRRFTFWRRQREQKVELFVVFLIGLLLILGIIALIVTNSIDPAGVPLQGSGR